MAQHFDLSMASVSKVLALDTCNCRESSSKNNERMLRDKIDPFLYHQRVIF